jgi:hypothetical protein
MSYRSRLYNHRNAQSPEKKNEQPFFSNQRADKKPRKSGFFQAKLSVNEPGDSFEKEADAAADSVVNHQGKTPGVQRKKISKIQRHSSPKEDEKLATNDARIKKDKEIQEKPMDPGEKEKEKKPVQKQAMPEEEEKHGSVQMKEESGAAVHSDIADRIANCSGGDPLPQKTLREMEASFGADFTDVRIHTDSDAVELCQQLGAQAFTHGKDIFFNAGKFNPESASGKLLLAHELTHIIQQSDEKGSSEPEA